MRQYFEKMDPLGKPLSSRQMDSMKENIERIEEMMRQIDAEGERIKNVGVPLKVMHERGEMSVWERIDYLVDPGTFRPLHTIFDPENEESGSTGVVDGLARINGKWCILIGFNNKWMAGAWIAGQPDNNLRATDIAKILHIPLVWLVNCSGVKLPEQEKMYANRQGQGTCFFRHAELEQMGIPVIAGIYGTNPAGGGYQGISPTILLAHKKANIAVGGGGIVSGMSPKGAFDEAGAEEIITATRHFKSVPPGSVKVHYDVTGFFRAVFDEETQVLDAIKDYMADIPGYNPRFFRVAEPAEPKYPPAEIASIIPMNKKRVYDFEQVLARLTDNSEHLEFRPGFGPEMYTGLVKIDGYLIGVVGNRQGLLPDYPEYTNEYIGVGGKLYRQGLIKMSEFVTLCSRDKVPMVWFQDTSGIDVGDIAEKAELLGLGQALIYSIENSRLPMMGESPTRPGILPCNPPVEVPAAMLPARSSATTPTVPCTCESADSSIWATGSADPGGGGGAPAGRGGTGRPSFFKCLTSDCQRASVKKKLGSTCSSPTCAANASALGPTNITYGDFSITARERLMGCRVRVTPATAPAIRFEPSMMAESSSFFPSAVKTAPWPALKSGSSSRTWIAASTASSAEPPRSSTLAPAASA
jgi:glutaconyl-CoA decarboxylase